MVDGHPGLVVSTLSPGRKEERGSYRLAISPGVHQHTILSVSVSSRRHRTYLDKQKPTKQSNHARPASSLQKTDKEPQRINLVGVLHRRQSSRQNSSSDLHPRKPQTRPDVGHDDLGWDQHDDVPDVKEGCEAGPRLVTTRQVGRTKLTGSTRSQTDPSLPSCR